VERDLDGSLKLFDKKDATVYFLAISNIVMNISLHFHSWTVTSKPIRVTIDFSKT